MEKKTVSNAVTMIRFARLKKGYTQLELGRMLGYNYSNFIAMIQNGVSMVPINMISQHVD
jgi:transcriptional regulator with XRE-family HTH domain